jgi:RNA polymerase sigma factor (sigma-70 family)
MATDAQLLQRYAESHSETAFAELVQRHLNLVYGAALRRIGGDSHRAMDVTQEVFSSLARHAGSLSRHTALTGWLYSATRNASINILRAEHRRKSREQEAQAVHEFSMTSPTTDWERVRPVIDDVMDQLDSADREAVLLRFFDGRPFAEIGAVLGLTDDAARKRVERALEQLRGMLERRGVTSTSAAIAALLANQAIVAAPVGAAMTITNAALAAVAAGASGTVGSGILTFMSSSTVASSVVSVLAGLALVAAGYEFRKSRRAEASLASVDHAHSEMVARLVDVEQRIQSAEQQNAQLRQTLEENRARLAAANSAPAKSAEPAKTSSPAMNPVLAGKEFMARHPEAWRLLADDQKANWAIKYAPLYNSLGLTAAQVDQMGNLMLQGRPLSSRITTGEGSINLSVEPATTMSREEVFNEARAILGESGFDRLRDYDRGALAFELMAQVAGTVFRSAPMSRETADQVAQVLANASATYRAGKNFDRATVEWNSVIEQSQPLLSPLQLAALVNLRTQEEYRKVVMELTRAADAAALRDANAGKPGSH